VNDTERVEEILGRWREARDQGVSVDPEDVIRKHPDLADKLRERFAVMHAVDRVFHKDTVVDHAPKQVGDYRIVKEIGRGGMGVVYEAMDTKMDRRVALKVLALGITGTGDAVRRFQREAKAAGRLHHTNIVPIYGMDQHAGQWYYAMELVEGQSLSGLIAGLQGLGDAPTEESLARLSIPAQDARQEARPASTHTGDRAYFVRVAEMFAGAADALQLAHEQGIVHRDVKPSNLLVAPDGRLKLVDFGLARLEGDGVSMTMTGDLLGTPAYMSPEQAMAKRMDLDHRTDIYSLGATLYEVLTLRRPFDGKSLQEVCSQIITKDPVLPRRANRKIPKDLETIVLKAMEKDRTRRYASAADMARDLRLFAEGGSIRARSIGVTGRAWRKVKRHRVRSALAASLAIAATLGFFFWDRATKEAAVNRENEYLSLCSSAQIRFASNYKRDPRTLHLLDEAIELMPDRPDAYFWRALAPLRSIEPRLADIDAAEARGLSSRAGHLLRAFLLAAAGRLEDAERAAAIADAQEGTRPDDAYFESAVLYYQGRFEEALAPLDKFLKSSGSVGALRRVSLDLRCCIRQLTGDFEGALHDAHALEALVPNSLVLRSRIPRLWKRIGNADRATKMFEDLIEDLKGTGGWHEIAARYAVWGEHEWGFEIAKRGLAEQPDHARLLQLYVRVGEFGDTDKEDLLAKAQHAWRLTPNSDTGADRANLLLRLGREEEARTAWAEAERLGATADAYAMWSLALGDTGHIEERLQVARSAAHKLPESSDTAKRLGGSLVDNSHYAEGLKTLERALRLDPTDEEAQAYQAMAFQGLGRQEEALVAAEAAVALNRTSPLVFTFRGLIHFNARRYAAALADANRAIELGGYRGSARSLRCLALVKLGRTEEALTAQEDVARRQPTNPVPWTNLASSYVTAKKPEDALRCADKAIELIRRSKVPPRDLLGMAVHNRARALAQLGRHKEALESYRERVALAADNPNPKVRAEAVAVRGWGFFHLGRTEEARQDWRTALELDPSQQAALEGSVNLAIAEDRREDMLRLCEQGIRHHPEQPAFYANALSAALTLERWDDALRVGLAGFKRYPDNPYMQANMAGLLLDHPDESKRDYQRALELARKSAQHGLMFQGNVGQALCALDRPDEAIPIAKLLIEKGRAVDQATGHMILAIARQKQGRAREARESYEKGEALYVEHAPKSGVSMRAEARKVLGIKQD